MKRRPWLSLLCTVAILSSLSAGTLLGETFQGKKSVVNTDHTAQGYVSVNYAGDGDKKIKVIIEKGTSKYTYDLPGAGTATAFPLQMGDGSYKLKVLENSSGNKYSVVQTCDFDVKLKDEFAPFLVANQFVDYTDQSKTVAKAAEVTKGCKVDLEKVDKIYAFVAESITYDQQKAQSVTSGYLPSVDKVLESKKGICFDYAALMAAMLRSQNIPTKLVTGFAAPNGVYHAWNEVYIKDKGWIKTGKLYFDGKNWGLTDSTFLSSSKGSNKVTEYIGDGSNYTKKYEY